MRTGSVRSCHHLWDGAHQGKFVSALNAERQVLVARRGPVPGSLRGGGGDVFARKAHGVLKREVNVVDWSSACFELMRSRYESRPDTAAKVLVPRRRLEEYLRTWLRRRARVRRECLQQGGMPADQRRSLACSWLKCPIFLPMGLGRGEGRGYASGRTSMPPQNRGRGGRRASLVVQQPCSVRARASRAPMGCMAGVHAPGWWAQAQHMRGAVCASLIRHRGGCTDGRGCSQHSTHSVQCQLAFFQWTSRFTWGDFQPDCSADRPVTGPRQST
eukprot:1138920-Pelagomonas_calceolata.AAC.5